MGNRPGKPAAWCYLNQDPDWENSKVRQYWIKEPGPRRPFQQYVSFLFGNEADCDTDGNAVSATDCSWTELTVINRRIPSERVDVLLRTEKPLTLLITSDSEELATRLAYALVVTAGGNVFTTPDESPVVPHTLVWAMGDFDVGAALARIRAPEDYDMGFVCKACGDWFADKDVKEWNTKWSEPDAEGERWLLEIIHKCPLCGEVRSYDPNECVLRGIWLGHP